MFILDNARLIILEKNNSFLAYWHGTHVYIIIKESRRILKSPIQHPTLGLETSTGCGPGDPPGCGPGDPPGVSLETPLGVGLEMQGLFVLFVCVGSSVPVSVSRLFHNKYTGYN